MRLKLKYKNNGEDWKHLESLTFSDVLGVKPDQLDRKILENEFKEGQAWLKKLEEKYFGNIPPGSKVRIILEGFTQTGPYEINKRDYIPVIVNGQKTWENLI